MKMVELLIYALLINAFCRRRSLSNVKSDKYRVYDFVVYLCDQHTFYRELHLWRGSEGRAFRYNFAVTEDLGWVAL